MMKKVLFSAALLLFFCVTAGSSTLTQDIYESAAILLPALNIGAGARAIAMGEAACAVVSDSSAIFWNPAGLSAVKDLSFALEYKKWFMDASVAHLMGVIPFKEGSLGLALTYSGMGFFEQIDQDGYLTGVEYHPYSLTLASGYGMELFSGLSFGITAKGTLQNVAEKYEGSLVFDFGMNYTLADIFFAGACAKNLKIAGSYPSPVDIKAGLGTKWVINENHNIVAAADASFKISSDNEYCFGAEYNVFKVFSARAGYIIRKNSGGDYGNMSGLRFGAGVKTGILNVDYAAMFFGDMGVNHVITLEINYVESGKTIVERMSTDYHEKLLAKRYMEDAMIYYRLSHYEEALNLIGKALLINPENENALKWKKYLEDKALPDPVSDTVGALQPEMEQLKIAAKFYSEDKYLKALETLKDIKPDSRNYENARVIIEKINERLSSVDSDVAEARALAGSGDVLGAVRKLETARSKCPGCVSPQQAYSDISREAAKKAKEYYLRGVEEYTGGNVKDSLKYWEYVIELAPDSEYGKNAVKNIEKAKEKIKAIQRLE